jgi:hypothetical protein
MSPIEWLTLAAVVGVVALVPLVLDAILGPDEDDEPGPRLARPTAR